MKMMKTTAIAIICALGCSVTALHAQSGNVAAGGNASGSNGTVSYSVGQANYITESGSDGIVTQGLQQPFEIMVITGIEREDIKINLSVYPNPSDGNVMLSVDNDDSKNMQYTLFDASGKFIRQNNLSGTQTVIPMTELADGIYFIKVLQDKTELKTFQIIKNK